MPHATRGFKRQTARAVEVFRKGRSVLGKVDPFGEGWSVFPAQGGNRRVRPLRLEGRTGESPDPDSKKAPKRRPSDLVRWESVQ